MRCDPPIHLNVGHDLTDFDSGAVDLDRWLTHWARRAELGDTARTYVTVEHGSNRVRGYYSLAASAIRRAETGGGALQRNAPDPVPVILLARLAVDAEAQAAGIGASLLQDAVLRSVGAGRVIGARAVLVHAVDDSAAAFYRRFGFRPLPSSGRTLFHPLASIAGLVSTP